MKTEKQQLHVGWSWQDDATVYGTSTDRWQTSNKPCHISSILIACTTRHTHRQSGALI